MPEDLKLSQIGSSQLPLPFRGLHSPGVRKHCQIIFACYFRKSSIWLHSLVCQIHNKKMLQLVAYSGNICVWVVSCNECGGWQLGRCSASMIVLMGSVDVKPDWTVGMQAELFCFGQGATYLLPACPGSRTSLQAVSAASFTSAINLPLSQLNSHLFLVRWVAIKDWRGESLWGGQ